MIVFDPPQRSANLGREVAIDIREDVEGQGRDHIVGLDAGGAAIGEVFIGDAHTALAVAQGQYLCAAFDIGVEARFKGERNTIHAAHWLQHGGLPVDEFIEQDGDPQVGIE